MKITQQEVENRLSKKFPDAKFKILQYSKMCGETFTIKCLKCGKILSVQNCSSFLHRNNFCDCSKKERTISRIEECEQICKNNNMMEFVGKRYRENTQKWEISALCKKCKQVFTKDVQSFLVNQQCPYCNKKHNVVSTISFKQMLPKEYELISEYVNNETKVLIRHNCGFIWSIKPHTFWHKINNGYTGCPHCNHKRSQGELKIETWLRNKNIKSFSEYIFPWSSNSKFRYDFYIPEYNLIIEYMGAQHYKEVSFFHDTLEERKSHDEIKEKEARAQGINYLVIPYTSFKNINEILENWFNDYSEKK